MLTKSYHLTPTAFSIFIYKLAGKLAKSLLVYLIIMLTKKPCVLGGNYLKYGKEKRL